MDTHTPIHDRSLPWLGTGTKWIPIHLYMTADFPGLVQVQNGYPYTYIHDRSLPWLGTGTKWIPIHLYMTADFPDLVQVQNGYLYTYT